MKLSIKAYGFTTGILLGVIVFLITIYAMIVGGGGHFILLSKFFFGYKITLFGAILGLVWGFIYGFILGALFAWIHNWFVRQ
ncbi:MAG: hypothetical protein AB1756_05010 [Acidobacteriota bacterium]